MKRDSVEDGIQRQPQPEYFKSAEPTGSSRGGNRDKGGEGSGSRRKM